MTSKHIETTLIGAGRGKRYTRGSVNPSRNAPLLGFRLRRRQKHATAQRAHGELFYGRRGTLTHFALQDAMVELEGGAGCVLYPCGAAVANAILSFVGAGDHLLVTGSAYEPTRISAPISSAA